MTRAASERTCFLLKVDYDISKSMKLISKHDIAFTNIKIIYKKSLLVNTYLTNVLHLSSQFRHNPLQEPRLIPASKWDLDLDLNTDLNPVLLGFYSTKISTRMLWGLINWVLQKISLEFL